MPKPVQTGSFARCEYCEICLSLNHSTSKCPYNDQPEVSPT
jgi:hypothetical protein